MPWFVYFVFAVAGFVAVGISLRLPPQFHTPTMTALLGGVVICLLFNIATLNKAGIWIAYSLPHSLRNTSRPWMMRAILALAVASLFYMVSHASWMPMIWQGAVVPLVFTVALFIALWHVLGPLLRWCSTLPFSRIILFVLSLPLFATVPITAVFLGETIFDAYQASQPNFSLIATPKPLPEVVENGAAPNEASKSPDAPETPAEKKSSTLQALAEQDGPCTEESREIQKAMEPSMSEDIAYWGIKASRCAQIKSVIALPKLVRLMQSHPSHKVRAAAISAMPQYGTENVKLVTYLLIRRISSNEPPEVIEAAANVFSRLPEDDRNFALKRLSGLLSDPKHGELAAQLLAQKFKRSDLVSEFVAGNLAPDSLHQQQAIGMICLLPKAGKTEAEAHIQTILAAMKSGDENDPSVKALDCLGTAGLKAVQKEVTLPQQIDRTTAARALATMDTKKDPEILKTVSECSKDDDATVRKFCGQTLGQMGKIALPKIIELLGDSDGDLKATGRHALQNFHDLEAKDELKRIRARNSGWLANQRKIKIARAVDQALMKLESEERDPSSSGENAQ